MGVIEREEIADGILTLSLDRPEKLNALNTALLEAIARETRRANEEGYPVLVFEGNGDAFTAGLDLDEAEDQGVDLELFQDMTRAVREFEGLVIGKLHGYTVGGGFEFTLSFDLRYAAAETTFQMTEAEVGVTVSNASTRLLPLIVGDGRAREMVFTGREVDASEALEIGLVADVHPMAELDERVEAVARDIATTKSASACANIKRGFNEGFPVDGALAREKLLHHENTAGDTTGD